VEENTIDPEEQKKSELKPKFLKRLNDAIENNDDLILEKS